VQCRAEQCRAVQSSAEQSNAEQCEAVQWSYPNNSFHISLGLHVSWRERCSRFEPISRLFHSAVQCSAVQCSAVQCSAVQCSAECGFQLALLRLPAPRSWSGGIQGNNGAFHFNAMHLFRWVLQFTIFMGR
jgi:hypothetical protein